jgi:hypothetical protein
LHLKDVGYAWKARNDDNSSDPEKIETNGKENHLFDADISAGYGELIIYCRHHGIAILEMRLFNNLRT